VSNPVLQTPSHDWHFVARKGGGAIPHPAEPPSIPDGWYWKCECGGMSAGWDDPSAAADALQFHLDHRTPIVIGGHTCAPYTHVGWLWRGPNRGWVFRIGLEGRTYPDGSQFVPVYSCMDIDTGGLPPRQTPE